MEKTRLGYVGCGFMAQAVHVPNIMATPDCELVALAEIRPQLGKLVQSRYRIPSLYASHTELAKDKSVDAVVVSGHYAAQGEIAMDLLRAGKDVLMEKPMAISIAQGERILEAERKSGKRLMVAYMKRYDAGNILVKKTMDELRASGAMGKLTFVRNHGFGGDWTAGLDVPRDHTDEPYPPAPNVDWPEWCGPKVRDGYLGYLQQYTHNVNLIRWLLNVEGALKVKAVDLNGCNGVVILDADGVRCTIESGWVPYEGWDEHTQIFFEKGWVKTGAPPLLLRNVPASVEVYHAAGDEKVSSTHFPAGGRTWSYKMEMAHFVECVRGNKPFRSPAKDAMEDVRTLEHIYRECARQMK